MKAHWTETAERVNSGDWRILGENSSGSLFIPRDDGYWFERFDAWNPMHWQYWLRSRVTRRIAFLEDAP